MEALDPIGAEIVEIPPGSEEEFIRAARDADALYVKARRITKRMIDGLERCRVISLGMVGVDSVDVAAATARGIPVTNVPDTFIEEVADHALMLILAAYRRLDASWTVRARGPVGRGAAAPLPVPAAVGPDPRAASPSGTSPARSRDGRGRSASRSSPTIPTSTRPS